MSLSPVDIFAIQSALDRYEKAFPDRPSPSPATALVWKAGDREFQPENREDSLTNECGRLSWLWESFLIWWEVSAVPRIGTTSCLSRLTGTDSKFCRRSPAQESTDGLLLLRGTLGGSRGPGLVFAGQPHFLLALPLLQRAQRNAQLLGLSPKASPIHRESFRPRLVRRRAVILHEVYFTPLAGSLARKTGNHSRVLRTCRHEECYPKSLPAKPAKPPDCAV